MMKRIICCMLAIIPLCNIAVAQWNYGFKAGLNLSSMDGIVEYQPHAIVQVLAFYPPLVGGAVGGFIRYDFQKIKWLAVQLDAMFSMQGARNIKFWQAGEYHTINTFRQNYMQVPIAFDIKPFRRVPISFLLGIQLGGCIYRRMDDTEVMSKGHIFNTGIDASTLLGVRYVFNEHLTAEFRMLYGASPCIYVDESAEMLAIKEKYIEQYKDPLIADAYFSQDHPEVYKTVGARNMVLQLTIGWTIKEMN